MGNIGTFMVVVDWLLISGMTNRAEKLILLILIIIPERCVLILFGGRLGVDNGGRQDAVPTVLIPL
jgi:hypothetical protein